MSPRRTRTLVLLVSLLTGAISTGVAQEIGSSTSEEFSLRVPAGRIGDHWELIGHGESKREGEASNQTKDFHWAYEVEGLTDVVDRHGQVRSTVKIVRWIKEDSRKGFAGDIRTDYIDLQTRQLVRSDSPATSNATEPAITASSQRVFSSYWIAVSDVARHQNSTLRFGDSLTRWSAEEPDCQPPSYSAQDKAFYKAKTVDRWVAERGRMGEEDVIGVRGRVTWEEHDGAEWWFENDTWLEWFSASSPYAVRREFHLEYSEPGRNQSYDESVVLANYRPGTQPIPWSSQVVASCHAASSEGVERSGLGNNVPADGSTYRLRYTLAAARQSIDTDPTLVELKQWKDAHPKGALAGFFFAVRSEIARQDLIGQTTEYPVHYSWELLFADGRSVARVRSILYPDSGLVRNQFLSVYQTSVQNAYYESRLEPDPITIGYAVERWLKMAPRSLAERGPEFITWGVAGNPATDVFSASYQSISVQGVRTTGTGADAKQLSFIALLDTRSGDLMRSQEELQIRKLSFAATLNAPPEIKSVRDGSEQEVGAFIILFASSAAFSLLLMIGALQIMRWLSAAGIAIPGYAKLSKEAVLNSPLRENLVRRIAAEPGLSASQLWRQEGAGWSTVVYHLRVLEENSVVSSLRDGRHKRFFPAQTFNHGDRARVAVLQNRTTARALEVIGKNPGIIQRGLARAIGVTPQAAQWHVSRLAQMGLLRRERDGRQVRLYHASLAGGPKASLTIGFPED